VGLREPPAGNGSFLHAALEHSAPSAASRERSLPPASAPACCLETDRRAHSRKTPAASGIEERYWHGPFDLIWAKMQAHEWGVAQAFATRPLLAPAGARATIGFDPQPISGRIVLSTGNDLVT
jgi:hypothetical protein